MDARMNGHRPNSSLGGGAEVVTHTQDVSHGREEGTVVESLSHGPELGGVTVLECRPRP